MFEVTEAFEFSCPRFVVRWRRLAHLAGSSGMLPHLVKRAEVLGGENLHKDVAHRSGLCRACEGRPSQGVCLLAEDLDGDGHPDLAAPDFEGNILSVHYTDGTSRLGMRQDLSVGQYPWEVAAGDLDGDGVLDLVTANGNSSDMSILLQRAGREFEPPRTIPINGNPHGVAAFDADRDGDVDIVTANDLGEDIAVFLNDGMATFAAPLRFPLGRRPYSILAAELDGDGVIDLVTTNERSASVSVLRGRGGGGFSTPQQFQVGFGPHLTAGDDFDGDGDIDLVVASRSGTQISLFINNSATSGLSVDFLTLVCTPLDFSTISVEGAGPPVRRLAHYLLAAGEAPEGRAAAFPNVARFGDSRRFLLESFPEEFPSLDEAEYEALVGRRKTRGYFTGSIRTIETAAGLVYGIDIATADGEGEELLGAAETAAVLALFAEAFRLEPRVYAPQTPAAKERAKTWQDPGFEVLILENACSWRTSPCGTNAGSRAVQIPDRLASASCGSVCGGRRQLSSIVSVRLSGRRYAA
jgi:hypothetical protein